MVTTAYKYKVYFQKNSHERKLSRLTDLCAEIYNHIIELRKRYYSLYHKGVSLYTMQAHIAKMKKRCYKQWSEVNSQTAQEIAERIYAGYDLFFKKEAKRPPQHKNRNAYWSMTFKNTGWALNGNEFVINKQRLRLRFAKSREIDGKVQTVNLKKDKCGDWWLTFVIRKEQDSSTRRLTTGKTAGFDFGLKDFLTGNDGTKIKSPLFFKSALKDIKHKSKNLSKKVKGSNNRRKAKKDLARAHRKIANKRSDFLWKLANELVKKYDKIVLEDLNIKAMQRRWGRKVSDLGFSDFVRILAYLCAKHGVVFEQSDRFAPTSKTCSNCGYVLDVLPLSVREWTCPNCGVKHDRDVNAAKNILRVGASTHGGGDVRRSSDAVPVETRISLPLKSDRKGV